VEELPSGRAAPGVGSPILAVIIEHDYPTSYVCSSFR
jgi:hypothetical protein